MAQKTVQIENERQLRYTAEIVDGNTVRTVAVPQETEQRQLRRNLAAETRERTLRMNMRYVLFLTAAAVATVTICIFYLKLQAVSTQMQKQTIRLQTQLKDIRMENDTVYSEILSGVDLEHVKEVAMNELGMTYPSENQIIAYDAAPGDYVRQFEEIPD
jgi:cell division protein FtsL